MGDYRKMNKIKYVKNKDSYYYGDKPNPNLSKFIEQHIINKPYNPSKDYYTTRSFDKPIMSTKLTAIYNMHTYWSKKPHTAITQYIKHYTEPGDLILDPMCGSGGTALTALLEGARARRMVRRGEMQPHDFDLLLKQVAESSIVNNGSGTVERWYLKESQMDSVDQAETAREDAAAESVSKFIVKSIESNPAEEGVHYSDIFEHYIYAVQDKPRRELRDWLIDYFYVTPEGTYRPPMTDEEERLKQEGRAKGLSRRVRRFVSMVEKGVPVPEGERPDGVTLVEWILHCRRSGLFSEGRVLYERGGLSFDDLSEETQVEVEEAYHSITKQGGK